MSANPPSGTPFDLEAPALEPAAVEVNAAGVSEIAADYVDLRPAVPTPYGGRLADLDSILSTW